MSLDERNAVLEEKLENNPIDDQIAALVKASNKLKLIVVALAIVIVGVGLLAIQGRRTASKAENAQAAIIARCEATNEARAKNARLWDFIIDQSKNAPRDAEKQKFFDDFVALKEDTFAPTDCSAVKK